MTNTNTKFKDLNMFYDSVMNIFVVTKESKDGTRTIQEIPYEVVDKQLNEDHQKKLLIEEQIEYLTELLKLKTESDKENRGT